MKKIAVIRAFCITLAFIFMMPVTVSNAQPDHRRESNTAKALYAAAEKAAEYKKSLNSDIKSGFLFDADFLKTAESSEAIRWLYAFSALGFYDDYSAYSAILTDNAVKRKLFPNKKSSAKPLEMHIETLGLMACGMNPNEIAVPNSGDKIDLVKECTWGRNKSKPIDKDGMESLFTALLSLDGLKTIIPDGKEVTNTRESIITKILALQNDDGSFSETDSSTAALTALAAAALAPYKNSDIIYNYTSVRTKNEQSSTVGGAILRALTYLSENRTPDGGYSDSQSEVKDISFVITSLCSLGLNPEKDERFLQNGKSLTDILLSYQNEDGSFSDRNSRDKSESSSFAVMALAAQYRFLQTGLGIYDFTDRLNTKRIKTLLSPNITVLTDCYYLCDCGLLSSDDYEEIVILTDRAENSLNAKNTRIYIKMLREIGDRLYKSREEIREINALCRELLQPDTVIGTKYLYEISAMERRYTALPEAEKAKITGFNEVLKKKSSMRSNTMIIYIFIVFLCIMAVALVIFLASFFLKSSPLFDYFIMKFLSKRSTFSDENDSSGDPEEFSGEDYDAPLPYEDDENFFDYVPYDDDDGDTPPPPPSFLW